MKRDTGSAVVAAMETAYADVRRRHADLPEVMFITGTGLMGRGAKWGHYWRDRWVENAEGATANWDAITAGRRPEVFIAGERLACGAEDVFETILHEAAHALAVVRGIKDTSREGRYHNGRYRALAEELGLTYPHETPHPVIGFSETALTDETRKDYARTIESLAQAITVYLDTFKDLGLTPPAPLAPGAGSSGRGGDIVPGQPRQPAKKDRNYQKAECPCGRVIRASTKTLDEGEIRCGICGQEFLVDVH